MPLSTLNTNSITSVSNTAISGTIIGTQLGSGITGQVSFFAFSTAPTGWLKANGAEISRTTYAPLFAVIGTTYGSGNGTTTFNIPDLRGEFLRGWDDSRAVDSGRTFASSQSSQNKFEFNDLFVNPHDGGSNMGAENTQYGLGDAHIPLQVGNTGYPDNYGNFAKRIAYAPWTVSVDTTLGNGKYGIAYNRLRVPVGVSGSLDDGTLTANSEARTRNVSLLACIKY
jgi:microcystin-dependent protein